MRARLRMSRNSAARFSAVDVLEVLKQLLCRVDDRVRFLALEHAPVVDAAPRHARRRACRLPSQLACRTASRRRTPSRPDRRPCRVAARSSGSGSGLWRSVSSPPTTVSNRCPSGTRAKASSTVERRFAVTTPSRRPSSLQAHEHILHPEARLELVVQRLVVGAVDAHELVDVIGSEHRHLRLEPGAADRMHQLGVGEFATEHLARGMAHRREDDRARVDDGAVEVEENDRETRHYG